MATIKTIESECGKLPDGRVAILTATAEMNEAQTKKGFYCSRQATNRHGEIVCDRGQLDRCNVYYTLRDQIRNAAYETTKLL